MSCQIPLRTRYTLSSQNVSTYKLFQASVKKAKSTPVEIPDNAAPAKRSRVRTCTRKVATLGSSTTQNAKTKSTTVAVKAKPVAKTKAAVKDKSTPVEIPDNAAPAKRSRVRTCTRKVAVPFIHGEVFLNKAEKIESTTKTKPAVAKPVAKAKPVTKAKAPAKTKPDVKAKTKAKAPVKAKKAKETVPADSFPAYLRSVK